MASKQNNLAALVREEIQGFALKNPANRMPTRDNLDIFETPLVQFADGADAIFDEYKKIISPEHRTPREALAQALGKSPADMPARLTVISWILPIARETRESNRKEKEVPSRYWSHTRWFGEIFNEALRNHVVAFLNGKGYPAAAPGLPPHIKMFSNEKGMYSNWSERHIAYAAGLGTFSLSDGFITERGIAHRTGSVVAAVDIPASPRTARGPYDNCLFYANGKCHVCVERCVAGAITESGHDKIKCRQRLHDLGYNPEAGKGYDLEKSVAGCGLCQTAVPCEAINPVAKLKK